MVDFKAKLEAERKKKKLEKELAAIKKQSAPSMNPFAHIKPEKEVEPPPPDLREFDIPQADMNKIQRLLAQHRQLTIREGQIKKLKKPVTEQLKELSKQYGLEKFLSGDIEGVYYQNSRSAIKPELLLANGVSMEIIKKSVETKKSWSFRTIQFGDSVNFTDEEE